MQVLILQTSASFQACVIKWSLSFLCSIKKTQTQIKVCLFLRLLFAHLALAELAAKTHGENCIFERWHFEDEGRVGKKSVWLKKGLLTFKCCSQRMKGKPAAMPKSFQVSVFIQHWTQQSDCQVVKAKH